MNWRDVLMEAIKDPAELKKMAEIARMHRHIEPPKYDYKMIEAEGREPGSDDE